MSGQPPKRKRGPSRVLPEPERVDAFKRFLANPDLRDNKGNVSYSRIFKEERINSPGVGFTAVEMASAYNQLFEPSDNDAVGYPNEQSKRSIKNKIKYTTKKHNPYLEIYSTPCVNTNGKREYRYHITDNPEDTKKQTDPMFKIGTSIIDHANKRIQNQKIDPVTRMRKVDLRDELYDRDSSDDKEDSDPLT